MPHTTTSRTSRRPACPAQTVIKCSTRRRCRWPGCTTYRCLSHGPDFVEAILMGVHMFRPFIAICFVTLGLVGCGSMRLVDTDVHSFTTAPLLSAGASYRFERLPSQQAQVDGAEQNKLEAMVQPALAKVGMQR